MGLFIAGFVEVFAGNLGSLRAVGLIAAQACMTASPVLCMFVPKQSGARIHLWISQGLLTANLVLQFVGETQPLPMSLILAQPILSFVGTLFLFLFFKKLAEYLGYGGLIDAARSLIKAFVTMVGAGGFSIALAIYGYVNCYAAITFIGSALYAAFMYVALIYALTRSISQSLKEDYA